MDTTVDPGPGGLPLEDEARALLRDCPGDGLEAWLADQRWRAALDTSWSVEPARGGRTYRVEAVAAEAVRIVERTSGGGSVTAWLIG